MKRFILVSFLVFFFPTMVLAKSYEEEQLISIISDIKDVQVEENVKILSTTVEENKIIFEMTEENSLVKKDISYSLEANVLSFYSGKVLLQKTNDGEIIIQDIQNNEVAFYLYSILESKSSASYDEQNYYNNTQIKEKLLNLSLEEKKLLFEDSSYQLTYQDEGKTFEIELSSNRKDNDTSEITIYYHYYLDGKNAILTDPVVEQRKSPSSVNIEKYSMFITILLVLGIVIAGISYFDFKRKIKKG